MTLDPAVLLSLLHRLEQALQVAERTIAGLQQQVDALTADQEEPSWPTPSAT